MKAVTIEQFGGIEQMRWSDLPTPQPLAHEVQIQILYTAVNPVDWKIRNGSLQKIFPHQFPLIPGWDACGKISAVGKDVTRFKVGDEVYAYCRKSLVQWGTYAEYVCFDAKHVAFKPHKLSYAQAAAIPLVGLTAWQALFEQAQLKKGQTILIHAGAGGVGSIAIELAKAVGAKIYTTASPKNHAYVKKLGADEIADYRTQDVTEWISKKEPTGVDVVLDCVGYETLEKSFEIVKKGGHLISIVNAVNQEKAKQKGIHGAFVLVRPDGLQLEKLSHWFDEGKIVAPNIIEFSLKDFAKATKLNEEGHTQGKIVLRIEK